MSVPITLNQQNHASNYFNRKFAIEFNLPALGRLSTSGSFPSMTKDSALALAALSLNRLMVALNGVDQAYDGEVAGSEAAWAAELGYARTLAENALAAVAAAIPSFRPAAYVSAQLFEIEAQDKGRLTYPAPNQLDPKWFTANLIENVVPTIDNVVETFANNTAISFNLLAAANVVDPDSDVHLVAEINGTTIDYDNPAPTHVFSVNGKQFTFTKATQVLSANAQTNPNTWGGTFRVKDDEGGLSAPATWSVENLAP